MCSTQTNLLKKSSQPPLNPFSSLIELSPQPRQLTHRVMFSSSLDFHGDWFRAMPRLTSSSYLKVLRIIFAGRRFWLTALEAELNCACGKKNMSEMINSLNLKLGDYHGSSLQASGTDVEEWGWSGYLEDLRRGKKTLLYVVCKAAGSGGGRGCVASRACGHAYYWRSIFSLSVSGWSPEGSEKEEGFFFFPQQEEWNMHVVCLSMWTSVQHGGCVLQRNTG